MIVLCILLAMLSLFLLLKLIYQRRLVRKIKSRLIFDRPGYANRNHGGKNG